jgi:hypothetical protein
MCFNRQEVHEVYSDDDLKDMRKELFVYPFSTCPCGGRIVRSMVIVEDH